MDILLRQCPELIRVIFKDPVRTAQ